MDDDPVFADWSQAVSGCEVVIGEGWVRNGWRNSAGPGASVRQIHSESSCLFLF